MKSIISLAAVVCAFALNAATYQLHNGSNLVNIPGGEIVGIQCMTVDGSQSVTAKVVCSVTEVTNAYKTVSVPHVRYDFTITNYDGGASIATNVLDNFKYSDWRRGTTNLIVGAVKPVRTNITEQVSDGTRVKATYTKDIAIGNGTASNHYLLITPASTLNFFGGRIDVECGDSDNLVLLVK